MKIILDERETALYEKCKSMGSTIEINKRVLPIGDAIIATDDDREFILIERKSLSDLLASIKDGRYEEQSYRLIHSSGIQPHSIVYVIEGIINQLRTPAEKKLVYSAMTSLNIFKGFSIIRTSSVQETAEWILASADKIGRDLAAGKVAWTPVFSENNNSAENAENNIVGGSALAVPAAYCSVVKKIKKDNVTPTNIGEIILCQIPGISSVSAIAIMQKFQTISHLIDEIRRNPGCLDDIVCLTKGKARKLSKAIIQNILLYLVPHASVVGNSSDVPALELGSAN